MKQIFTHENRMIVFNMKNVLEGEGIETFVINEFAAGGAGDLATFDTWPELWIEDETRLAEARIIVQEILTAGDRGGWICRGCQERNDVSFRVCWNCGHTYE
ncbi:MAG: DUF2007 domain-containing protein [Gammaproteobacteria bacterium]|nr:DUF2007 domain-containing protein [Gammaproteobacteria bacterium]